MYPRLTDYWDEQVGAIDTGARRLAELSEDAGRAALHAISAAVTEHVRVVPDDLLAKVAVSFADDLYKAACGIDRWDEALDSYLASSAGTMSARLTERGLHLQYLVDNAWQDLTKPLHLLPHWYHAAGFVYACPAVVAFQLAAHDGLDAEPEPRVVLDRYGSEARDVVNQLMGRCQVERRPVAQLDTDSTPQSFDVALSARGKAGVITVFRDAAPEPGNTGRGLAALSSGLTQHRDRARRGLSHSRRSRSRRRAGGPAGRRG